MSSFESMRKRLELRIMAKKMRWNRKKVQRNLDLTKCHGTREIGSVYRGFVISRFFSIHYTSTALRNSFILRTSLQVPLYAFFYSPQRGFMGTGNEAIRWFWSAVSVLASIAASIRKLRECVIFLQRPQKVTGIKSILYMEHCARSPSKTTKSFFPKYWWSSYCYWWHKAS